jgi:hypothetical protein
MTLQEVLLQPDHVIIRSGAMMLIIAKEWRRITGGEPSVCDCQFKNYLRTVRNEYKTMDVERTAGNQTD